MNNILIPISPGELLDKITILEIKSQRITDAEKLKNVSTELQLLNDVWTEAVEMDAELEKLKNDLREVNGALWDIEDGIRDEEREKRFGEAFIKFARDVYFTNDQRADIKKQINVYLKSDIVEEKSYQDYQ